MTRPLTPKVEEFCQQYTKDMNGTQAAIRAGYSERTAAAQAARLLTKANVSARLQELIAQRSERTKIDADWMLRRLEQDSAADIADLYDEAGNIRPVREWPKAFRTGLVSGVETVQLGEAGEITVKKVKLVDRAKYLEMIGRHIDVGAFKDRVEVDVVDSLAARLERVRAKRAAK
jgi:phage terminase small subunit